jgi:O-antigen ligase
MSWSSLAEAHPVAGARSRNWRSIFALMLPLAAIAGVGAAKGGFFPTSFGWTGLAFAWTVVVAVSLVSARWRPLDLVWVGATACLCLLTFLSAEWAGSAADAIDAGFRTIVYLTGITAAMIVLRRRDIGRWLGGLVLGAAGICIYALATRLLPTHFNGFDSSDYRLFEPIGYWNALGIFAAVGLLLAIGVATNGRGLALRALSAAAAVAFAPTLLFTFSRGALLALGSGTIIMLALSPIRLRLIGALVILGAIPALSVLLASRATALTHRGATLAAASSAGHKLALELVVLSILQAGVAAAYTTLSERISVPQSGRRVLGSAIAATIGAGFVVVFVIYGSPVTIGRHAYDSFVSAAPSGSNLNGRLLSLSNNGRTVLWHSAWHDFLAHPLVGSGAGSFERWWLAHRTSAYFVTYAHNLYLQTLAELGIIGLLLLIVMLGTPLVAAVRARKNPLVAPAAGAYVAFLLHAAIDWDWEVPAVTLLALFTGAALVVAAHRGGTAPEPMRTGPRAAIGAIAIVAAVVAFVGLIGNIALSRSTLAAFAGNGPRAAAEAEKAHTWAPWSAEALDQLGRSRLIAGSKSAGFEALRQAAADDPGDWQIWFDIAAVATGAEQRAALARAKALNPQGPEIAAALASGQPGAGS